MIFNLPKSEILIFSSSTFGTESRPLQAPEQAYPGGKVGTSMSQPANAFTPNTNAITPSQYPTWEIASIAMKTYSHSLSILTLFGAFDLGFTLPTGSTLKTGSES